jgi:NAD(P)-dependent dehydrogenase (short-subunit alcohol dehydrogenase family)
MRNSAANQINYTTSKSALVGFGKTQAREFGGGSK